MCHTPPRVVTHQIWVEKPQEGDEEEPVDQRADARPSREPPGQPDRGGRERRVDPGLPLVGDDRPEDRDDRHQRDRRERRERHVDVAVDEGSRPGSRGDRRARPGRGGTRPRGRRSRRGVASNIRLDSQYTTRATIATATPIWAGRSNRSRTRSRAATGASEWAEAVMAGQCPTRSPRAAAGSDAGRITRAARPAPRRAASRRGGGSTGSGRGPTPTRSASAGRARIREPRRSDQRTGTIAIR